MQSLTTSKSNESIRRRESERTIGQWLDWRGERNAARRDAILRQGASSLRIRGISSSITIYSIYSLVVDCSLRAKNHFSSSTIRRLQRAHRCPSHRLVAALRNRHRLLRIIEHSVHSPLQMKMNDARLRNRMINSFDRRLLDVRRRFGKSANEPIECEFRREAELIASGGRYSKWC